LCKSLFASFSSEKEGLAWTRHSNGAGGPAPVKRILVQRCCRSAADDSAGAEVPRLAVLVAVVVAGDIFL
jgi:hypothetical protein